MFHHSFIGYLLLSLTFSLGIIAPLPPNCLSSVKEKVDKLVMDLDFSQYGIQVDGFLKERTTLYAHQNRKYFSPASNNKVLTTSAAFILFGKDYEFPVKVYNEGNDTICIKLVGQQDFTYHELKNLLDRHSNAKNIMVDDYLFGEKSEDLVGSWEIGDIPWYYSAQPIASFINENADVMTVTAGGKDGDKVHVSFDQSPVDLEIDSSMASTKSVATGLELRMQFNGSPGYYLVGSIAPGKTQRFSVSIPEPRNHLRKVIHYFSGKKPSSGICNGNLIDNAKTLPLIQIMNHTLLVSDNAYTELYLRHIGQNYMDNPAQSAENIGLQKIPEILKEFVDPSLFRQSDGSGLSRMNLMTPKALVDTLWGMQDRYGDSYSKLLPLAGETGTLKNRFLDHKGILRAKTGTMTSISALSGYLYNKHFSKPLVFSIIVNQSPKSAVEIRKTIDEIAVLFSDADPTC